MDIINGKRDEWKPTKTEAECEHNTVVVYWLPDDRDNEARCQDCGKRFGVRKVFDYRNAWSPAE